MRSDPRPITDLLTPIKTSARSYVGFTVNPARRYNDFGIITTHHVPPRFVARFHGCPYCKCRSVVCITLLNIPADVLSALLCPNWGFRLRQHNGEIKGGAAKTKRGGPWRMLAVVCVRRPLSHPLPRWCFQLSVSTPPPFNVRILRHWTHEHEG